MLLREMIVITLKNRYALCAENSKSTKELYEEGDTYEDTMCMGT